MRANWKGFDVSEKFKVGDRIRYVGFDGGLATVMEVHRDGAVRVAWDSDGPDWNWRWSLFWLPKGFELVKSKNPEPPFKVGDRITWGNQNVSGVVSLIDDENVFFHPELWQFVENGSHWQSSDDMISLAEILNRGVKIIQPKKEEKVQEIEVGSKWISMETNTCCKVVHKNSRCVFVEYDNEGGHIYENGHFLRNYKTLPKTQTRWTYVYRDKESDTVEIDYELFDTEEQAIADCEMVLFRQLIKTLKLEYIPE